MPTSEEHTTSFPARLHVLMAREAPYGVVIRRGPSERVCFVGWDRSTDSFTLGQWLKGRIYERRSHISPDGKYVVYGATRGFGIWTAISRAPYLKAIGLWTQRDHFNGGGIFADNAQCVLNVGLYEEKYRPEELVCSNLEGTSVFNAGECPVIYYPRLQHDGWRLVAEEKRRGDYVTIFEKNAPAGWTLRKYCHASSNDTPGRGSYWDEHELENFGEVLSRPNWEWTDMDGKRLVWAEHGRLFGARLTRFGIEDTKQLYDFNPMTFEAIKAPY